MHRYAISFFRQRHAKSMLNSELDNIEGLGETRKRKLLEFFETINQIKQASIEELAQVIPQKVAQRIYDKFKN